MEKLGAILTFRKIGLALNVVILCRNCSTSLEYLIAYFVPPEILKYLPCTKRGTYFEKVSYYHLCVSPGPLGPRIHTDPTYSSHLVYLEGIYINIYRSIYH